MPEQKIIPPLLDGLLIGNPTFSHGGIVCCPAIKGSFDNRFIVKCIRVPQSQSIVDALLITGALQDAAAADGYFRERADAISQEAEILRILARDEGFLSFEGCQYIPIGGNLPGYEVYLLSKYRLSLEKYMRRKGMTHLEAVNLGIDLCAAMAASRRNGLMYIDLKPSNIYITPKKEYRIGDLGFVSLNSLRFSSMPAKYRSPYTAPEMLDDMAVLNNTVDTYAIGMLMYQIFNNGQLPSDPKNLSAPAHGDDAINAILLKACALAPSERYADPTELWKALIVYLQGNTINSTQIMPPLARPKAASTEKKPQNRLLKKEAPAPAPEPVQNEPKKTEPESREETETEEIDLEEILEEIKPYETEPVKAEPIKAEPIKAEPVKVESVEAEPLEAEPVEAEPEKVEPAAAKPEETLPEETESDETAPDKAEKDVEAELENILDEDDFADEWSFSPFQEFAPAEKLTFDPFPDNTPDDWTFVPINVELPDEEKSILPPVKILADDAFEVFPEKRPEDEKIELISTELSDDIRGILLPVRIPTNNTFMTRPVEVPAVKPSNPVPEEVPVKIPAEPVPEEKPVEATSEPIPEEKPVEVTSEPVPEEKPVETTSEPVPEEKLVEILAEPVLKEKPTETTSEPVPEEKLVKILAEPVPEEKPAEVTSEPIPEEKLVEILAKPVPEKVPVGVLSALISEGTPADKPSMPAPRRRPADRKSKSRSKENPPQKKTSTKNELEKVDYLLSTSNASKPKPNSNASAAPVAAPVATMEKKKSNSLGLRKSVVALLLLGGISFGGWTYYNNYYLQNVNALTIEGTDSQLTVTVHSDIPDRLLTIECADAYGTSERENVHAGQASFHDLKPGSLYKIQVEVNGMHQLTGPTSGIFTTEAVTNVVGFTAVAGDRDGDLMLNLAVEGHEPSQWTLTYSSKNTKPESITFSGYNTSVSGLTVGETYHFELSCADGSPLTGQNILDVPVTGMIAAQNLRVADFSGDTITVVWDSQSEGETSGWRARCYNNNGYDEILEVSEPSATFSGINPAHDYTVEVTAAGMTKPTSIAVSANPVTIKNLQVDSSDPNALSLSWEYEGAGEKDLDCLLTYSIDGTPTSDIVRCDGATAVITTKIPGAVYEFTLLASEGVSLFNNVATFKCPDADRFVGHAVSSHVMITQLLPTPNPGWTYFGTPNSMFTDQFEPGQRISMVLKVTTNFYLDDEPVELLYVVRDQDGKVIPDLTLSQTANWAHLWAKEDYHYAELDTIKAPAAPGEYTLDFYLDGGFVTSTPFTVS